MFGINFAGGESAANKRKEAIENMISATREAKQARAITRETNLDLTERLDAQWKTTVTTTDAFAGLVATKEQREESNVEVV